MLRSILQQSSYPGRGIILGLNRENTHAVMAYFIMGRSENSRNRVFVPKGDGIITQAFEPSKMTDPSLIIYAPVRVQSPGVTVVTNGTQTDTIVDHLNKGSTFEAALRTRTFEPDAPNYTPRISGVMTVRDGRAAYQLSLLKAMDGDAACPLRFFFDYPAPKAGVGHFIHTYVTDGAPLPSFQGEPERVELAGAIDGFTDSLWSWLNAENRVSLFTRFICLETGETETRIVNRNR